jgi:ribosome-interacting GTPase 1
VEKVGAAQVFLVGPPNAGKSLLLSRLTNAAPEVAPYPYTTRRPLPGMMPFEDIQVQLVDTPAISKEFLEPWLPSIMRNADGIVLVVDASSETLLEQLEEVLQILEASKMRLARKFFAPAPPGIACMKTMLVANKMDLPGASENLGILRELYGERFHLHPVSALTNAGLAEFPGLLYEFLEIIRVYTKAPGEKKDGKGAPFILFRGATVLEVAEMIHKDFAKRLKFARVWGSQKYDGMKVQKDYVLSDGDLVELHV